MFSACSGVTSAIAGVAAVLTSTPTAQAAAALRSLFTSSLSDSCLNHESRGVYDAAPSAKRCIPNHPIGAAKPPIGRCPRHRRAAMLGAEPLAEGASPMKRRPVPRRRPGLVALLTAAALLAGAAPAAAASQAGPAPHPARAAAAIPPVTSC